MIKAVVFDLDNTLYDYDYCNKMAEEALFSSVSREFEVDGKKAAELLKSAKQTVKSILGENVAAAHNRLLYMQNICEQCNKNPFIYALHFYNTYWDHFLEQMYLFPYVKNLMTDLKKKEIKIAVLTDLTAYIQYRKIEKLQLKNDLDYMVTSEEAGAEKPSPQGFQLICKKMGFPPKEVLMVGDNQIKDIEGARSVGMHAIRFDKSQKNMQQVVLRYINKEAE